jgi:hypothetical protein
MPASAIIHPALLPSTTHLHLHRQRRSPRSFPHAPALPTLAIAPHTFSPRCILPLTPLSPPAARRRAPPRRPQHQDARVPSVPPCRVPLRARNVPTNSYRLRPWLLRAGQPAGRRPRPGRSQRGSRCVLRPAVLVLAREGAATVEEETKPNPETLTPTYVPSPSP